MRYESNKDYFIRDHVILLSRSGQNILGKCILSGSKIPGFFRETVDEINLMRFKHKIENAFDLWAYIYNFPETKPIDVEGRRKNCLFEGRIREYLREQLNLNFIGHHPNRFNIYTEEEIFGGVPDGEEFRDERVVSIIEIKKRDKLTEHPQNAHILQLALYMNLSGARHGYICIYKGKVAEPQDIVFNGDLVNEKINPQKITIFLTPIWQSEGKQFEMEYHLLERWSNDNQITLYKVEINEEKYKCLMTKIAG